MPRAPTIQRREINPPHPPPPPPTPGPALTRRLRLRRSIAAAPGSARPGSGCPRAPPPAAHHARRGAPPAGPLRALGSVRSCPARPSPARLGSAAGRFPLAPAPLFCPAAPGEAEPPCPEQPGSCSAAGSRALPTPLLRPEPARSIPGRAKLLLPQPQPRGSCPVLPVQPLPARKQSHDRGNQQKMPGGAVK